MIVVKVGGSLFDLPELGPRLRRWLEQWPGEPVILVPGGGKLADTIRELDRVHRLGAEAAHWLALEAMTLQGGVLAALLAVEVTADLARAAPGRPILLDALAFARGDEGRPGALPHSWRVTSDSVAARVAAVARARRLVLLKSVDIPAYLSWSEAARRGLVDEHFAAALPARAAVTAVNFRSEAACFLGKLLEGGNREKNRLGAGEE